MGLKAFKEILEKSNFPNDFTQISSHIVSFIRNIENLFDIGILEEQTINGKQYLKYDESDLEFINKLLLSLFKKIMKNLIMKLS